MYGSTVCLCHRGLQDHHTTTTPGDIPLNLAVSINNVHVHTHSIHAKGNFLDPSMAANYMYMLLVLFYGPCPCLLSFPNSTASRPQVATACTKPTLPLYVVYCIISWWMPHMGVEVDCVGAFANMCT